MRFGYLLSRIIVMIFSMPSVIQYGCHGSGWHREDILPFNFLSLIKFRWWPATWKVVSNHIISYVFFLPFVIPLSPKNYWFSSRYLYSATAQGEAVWCHTAITCTSTFGHAYLHLSYTSRAYDLLIRAHEIFSRSLIDIRRMGLPRA